MGIRELMLEYIMFAYDDDTLMEMYQITEEELKGLSDVDLLEIYDTTLLGVCNGECEEG